MPTRGATASPCAAFCPGDSKAEAFIAYPTKLRRPARPVNGPRVIAGRRAPQDPAIVVLFARIGRFRKAAAPRLVQPLHYAPAQPLQAEQVGSAGRGYMPRGSGQRIPVGPGLRFRRDVQPLRLAQQPVFLSRLRRQPPNVLLRVLPAHIGHGSIASSRLRNARIVRTPSLSTACRPFVDRHLEHARRERVRNRHLNHGIVLIAAPGIFLSTHQEAPGLDAHQGGALRAVSEPDQGAFGLRPVAISRERIKCNCQNDGLRYREPSSRHCSASPREVTRFRPDDCISVLPVYAGYVRWMGSLPWVQAGPVGTAAVYLSFVVAGRSCGTNFLST